MPTKGTAPQEGAVAGPYFGDNSELSSSRGHSLSLIPTVSSVLQEGTIAESLFGAFRGRGRRTIVWVPSGGAVAVLLPGAHRLRCLSRGQSRRALV